MNIKNILVLPLLLASSIYTYAQMNDAKKDSLYIQEVEDHKEPAKVLHAEPLYIDLIRDLGARKGEKEWNLGLGLTDKLKFDSYEALIEYEWAPIDRLGLEVELPFTFHSPLKSTPKESVPSNQLN
ncbi:MAG: phosphoribosylformylglycinamidine synthase, partial [Bacteroidota bacterium]|nr:phosphoribosylformylglycinamidine synthase [Bacteroidota bacterium]